MNDWFTQQLADQLSTIMDVELVPRGFSIGVMSCCLVTDEGDPQKHALLLQFGSFQIMELAAYNI